MDRIPPIADTDSTTVENTRSVHMLRNTGRPGIVLTRNIGCLCLSCISGEGMCKYPEYFQDWTKQSVSKVCSLPLGTDLWPVNLDSTRNAAIAYDESTVVDSENWNFDFEVDVTCTNIDRPLDTNLSVSDLANADTVLHERPLDTNLSVSDLENADTVLHEQSMNESEKWETESHPESIVQSPILYGNVKSWSEVLTAMRKLKSYIELQNFCRNLSLPFLPSCLKGEYVSAMDDVDALTVDVLKSANISIPKILEPVEIVADGNCLTRTFSKVKYGTECHHGEMRIRLVREAVSNEEKYINNEHLKVGACAEIQNAKFAQTYCLYSDHIDTCRTLTKRSVLRIYQNEWFEYHLLGTYSGIFQLHVAACVLKAKVQSYFPNRIDNSVFLHLHRPIFPIGMPKEDLKTYHVVWTKSKSTAARLEHFVPLLESET